MSTMTAARLKIKPTRRTAPFGTGVYPTRTRFEPSEDDRRWAAQAFGDDAPDWDARLAAGIETCEVCGRPTEPGELECGLCCVCMTRAEEATMRSQYAGVGMGWH